MKDELVDQVKAGIADSRQIPSLHDQLRTATASLVELVNTSEEFALETPFSDEVLAARTTALEDASKDLVRAGAIGGMYGDRSTRNVWPLLIGQLANTVERRSHGHDVWRFLHRYPAVLVAYGVGIGAVVGGRHDLLAGLLAKKTVLDGNELKSVSSQLHSTSAFLNNIANHLPGLARNQTAASDRVYGYLSALLANELVGGEPLFSHEFDRFEYTLGLASWDASRASRTSGWAPWGRHAWRREEGSRVEDDVNAEITRMGDDWPLLREGLFEGSSTRLAEAVDGYAKQMKRW